MSPAVAACCPPAPVQNGGAGSTPIAAAPSPAKLLKHSVAGDVAAAKGSAAAVPAETAHSPAAMEAVPPSVKSGSKAARPKPALAAATPSGQAAVGRCVKVYWKDDEAWYTGDVQGAMARGGVKWAG